MDFFVDSDLRTALPAGGFYWQVVMPAGTPGMSPVLLQLSVQWGCSSRNVKWFFFSKFWDMVCEFLLFWFCCVGFFFLEGVWGCFVCNTCSLYVTALQPAGFGVVCVPCAALGLFCRWHIRFTLQTFHKWKLQTPPFLTGTVSAILVLLKLNSLSGAVYSMFPKLEWKRTSIAIADCLLLIALWHC